jgi:hypothetical protein
MNARTDNAQTKTFDLDTLSIIRDSARSARLRIIDGRAKEAMAIFEHELNVRIETLAKASGVPKPEPIIPTMRKV